MKIDAERSPFLISIVTEFNYVKRGNIYEPAAPSLIAVSAAPGER